MNEKSSPRPLNHLLSDMMRNLGLDRRAREQAVFAKWAEAVGEPFCDQVRPVFVAQGRLVVAVRDSAWMQEMQFVKDDLKKKLNRALGKGVIREIRFKIGNWEEVRPARSQPEPEIAAPPLSPEVVAAAEAAAGVIKDKRLREQVLRTLLASARREALERSEGEDED